MQKQLNDARTHFKHRRVNAHPPEEEQVQQKQNSDLNSGVDFMTTHEYFAEGLADLKQKWKDVCHVHLTR